MKTPPAATDIPRGSLRRLVQLYARTSAACAKSNTLLNETSNLEQELFGRTRGDDDLDEIIDALEYAQAPVVMTAEDVPNLEAERIKL